MNTFGDKLLTKDVDTDAEKDHKGEHHKQEVELPLFKGSHNKDYSPRQGSNDNTPRSRTIIA
jgi:hypothetical protein